mgnify:CR=1 FL=1
MYVCDFKVGLVQLWYLFPNKQRKQVKSFCLHLSTAVAWREKIIKHFKNIFVWY